jgi:hypothetical protein
MARKLHPAPLTGSPELVTYKFRFQSAGTGTTDADFIVPAACGVKAVDQTAAGVWAIEFIEHHPTFVGMVGTVMVASGVGFGQVVQAAPADYSATTGILTVRTVDTYSDATPAAADVADNDWVYCEVTFCRRNDLAPSGALPLTSANI